MSKCIFARILCRVNALNAIPRKRMQVRCRCSRTEETVPLDSSNDSASSGIRQSEKLDTLYEGDELKNIMKCFNEYSESELCFFKLFKPDNASAIVKYRQENGTYKSLSAVLSVPGVGALTMKNACSRLRKMKTEHPTREAEKQSQPSIQTYPRLSQERSDAISSIIALDVQTDRITWTKVDRSLEIQAWQHTALFDSHPQKYDHVLFLERVSDFVRKLPRASLFTLESKIHRFPSLRIVPYVMNLRLLEGMLTVLLNKDFLETREHDVFLVKPHVINKYFSLSVGGERVSGQHIIREIIQNKSELVNDVRIGNQFAKNYFQQPSVQQERYAMCLLHAIAFYKLFVFKEPMSS